MKQFCSVNVSKPLFTSLDRQVPPKVRLPHAAYNCPESGPLTVLYNHSKAEFQVAISSYFVDINRASIG